MFSIAYIVKYIHLLKEKRATSFIKEKGLSKMKILKGTLLHKYLDVGARYLEIVKVVLWYAFVFC